MWLTDFQIVLPDQILEHGSLRIADGLIAEISDAPRTAVANAANATSDAIDGRGLTLIPGLIDLHGDMLEREIEPRPGAPFPIDLALFELDKRLAATGITTAFTALSFAWNEDDDKRSDKQTRAIIETVNALRDRLSIDMRVHGRFEVTNGAVGPLLTEMLDAGKLHLVSIMDHTPGQGQYKDVKKYAEFIVKWLGVDPEDLDPELLMTRIQARVARQQARAWSWDVVHDAVAIARTRGLAVASHDDDTAAKVDQLAALGVTISEFPVALEAADRARQHGMHIVMGAPNALRGYSHSGNLSTLDAVRAGAVDILATDYYPATLLHAPFAIAAQGILALPAAIRLVTTNPANAVQLADRGQIAVGLWADLALVETAPHRRVRGTLRGGQPIYWDADMVRRGTLLNSHA